MEHFLSIYWITTDTFKLTDDQSATQPMNRTQRVSKEKLFASYNIIMHQGTQDNSRNWKRDKTCLLQHPTKNIFYPEFSVLVKSSHSLGAKSVDSLVKESILICF